MKQTHMYFIIVLLLFFRQSSYGQSNFLQNLNTSGNFVSNNSGSVAYTIGQAFYSYNEGSSYTISEGIQQSNLLESIENETSGNEDSDDVNIPEIKIIVYPNPSSDFVTLRLLGLEFEGNMHSYQLYNYQGKLLSNDKIKQQNTLIDITSLSTSIYILQVFVEEKLWKTVKIQKN